MDGELKHLNEIDNDDLVNAFIKCVSLIDAELLPNCRFGEQLNITDKYRIATDLANAIKKLGYKAEIGYQTFLYFNEKESRRLFLFLFDKLSKQKQEEPKNVSQGLLNRLKKIEIDFGRVRKSGAADGLKWKTTGLDYLNYLMRNEVSDCVPFDNPSLFIEWNALNSNTNSKLFSNFYQNANLALSKEAVDQIGLSGYFRGEKSSPKNSPAKSPPKAEKPATASRRQTDSSDEQIKTLDAQIKQFEQQLEANKKQLKVKREAIKKKTESLKGLTAKFDEKKLELDRAKYSDRSNDELKEGISKMQQAIDEVNKKWQQFNLEFEESIGELKEKRKLIINRFNTINEEIATTKSQIETNSAKLKKIEEQTVELEQNLTEDNVLDRKFYTKRIFEIINNVKKQEQDIDKILADIRVLQREINQLSGKVARTYTVVEETVFKSSNLTDWSKRCYRLISELDEISFKLIAEIELSGQTKREVLRFEEIVSIPHGSGPITVRQLTFSLSFVQLESEKSNKIGSNLAKVTYDLEQIRKGKE